MADPKGDHLFVNLGPSQTRRRLDGFGHGVRKIRSAGRNQAVVIHTATGQHLAELRARFADVGCSTVEGELSEPIENLRNIGPSSAARLRAAGIGTIDQLQRLGPALAFRLVKRHQPRASLNLLWALAAGLADCEWRTLTEEHKCELKRDADLS